MTEAHKHDGGVARLRHRIPPVFMELRTDARRSGTSHKARTLFAVIPADSLNPKGLAGVTLGAWRESVENGGLDHRLDHSARQ